MAGEHFQCNVEKAIRGMAAVGSPKKEIRKVLGVSRDTFKAMLEALGDVKFHQGAIFEVRGFKGTIEEVLRHFKLSVSSSTVRWRMERGQSTDEAFFTPPVGERFTYRGFTGTTTEIIRHFDLSISRDTAFKRIKRGMSVDQAFSPVQPRTRETHPKVGRYKVYTVNGVTDNLANLHTKFKPPLAVETIRKLIREGMSAEDAFKEKKGKLTVRGFTGFIPEIIKHFNLDICKSTVSHRINYYGWDEDRAFFTPPDITRSRYNEYDRANLIPAGIGSVHAPIHV